MAISKTLTINCTEGGVHIKGTERMSFEEAIEQYCSEPIQKLPGFLDPMYSLEYNPQHKLKNLFKEYNKLENTLNKIKNYAKENEDLLVSVLEDIKSNAYMGSLENKLSRILSHNENVFLMILENEFINFYLRPLIAYMHVQVNPISRINSLERAEKILRIQGWFIENTLISIEKFKETYKKGLENYKAKRE